MAQPPPPPPQPTLNNTENAPPSSTHQQTRSHGRGGHGNINSRPSTRVDPEDFTTPSIKAPTFTTGRGGSGNMINNNDPSQPDIARKAQDVEAPAAHDKAMRGTYHWGRGGEGNMMTVDKGKDGGGGGGGGEGGGDGGTGAGAGGNRKTGSSSGERRGSLQGVLEKGKGILGWNKKTASAAAAKDENAIED